MIQYYTIVGSNFSASRVVKYTVLEYMKTLAATNGTTSAVSKHSKKGLMIPVRISHENKPQETVFML